MKKTLDELIEEDAKLFHEWLYDPTRVDHSYRAYLASLRKRKQQELSIRTFFALKIRIDVL
jgi:hypothetical protein